VYSWAPAEGNGTDQTSRFTSTPIRFPETKSVTGYHDLSPRLGVAYDLFGNGRTALKASVGRYLSAATADGVYSSQSPAGNFVRTVTNRAWTDSNGNFAVDCNLTSPAAQDTSATGGDVCAALTGANLNFGNTDPNTTRVDPALLSGWGVRPYNWRYGVSVQHEVRPGISVDAGYNRRHWGNFNVTYNELVECERLRRLDGSRAESSRAAQLRRHRIVRGDHVGGVSARFAQLPDGRRKRRRRVAHGVLAWRGLQRDGAFGRPSDRADWDLHRPWVRNTCALWRARPQLQGSNSADACDVTEPWLTSFRGLASYTIPRIDVLASTTIRSTRTTASENASNGSSLAANYQIPNTVVQTLLGPSAGWRVGGAEHDGQPACAERVVSARTPYGSGHPARQDPAIWWQAAGRRFDLYNLFNSNTTTAYDQTFLYSNSGATYLQPTAILNPRLARFNATLTF
jgi:hypothetical protein